MTYEATTHNIPIESPEPDKNLILKELLTKFTKEEIAYYYFARMTMQWHRLLEPKPEFEEYVIESLNKETRLRVLFDSDFKLENMVKTHQTIFDTPFDKDNRKFFEDNTISVRDNSIINKVARQTNVLRDVNIISRIEELWKNKKSIFAVFGGVHPIMQEAVIKAQLSE